MSGEKFQITDSEFENMAKAKGSVFIPSQQSWINMASISTMYPVQIADLIEDRKKQTTGVLKNGEHVRRHFGEWVLVGSGGDEPVYPNRDYYKEIRENCVASEEEYKQICATNQDYFEFMYEKSKLKRLGNSSIEKIGDLLQTKQIEEPDWCERHKCFLIDCSCHDQQIEDSKELNIE